MKRNYKKRPPKNRRSATIGAAVEYVSIQSARLRGENGQRYSLSTKDCPGLMPGDHVTGRLKLRRGRSFIDPASLTVEPCKQCQVVLRIRPSNVPGDNTKSLLPIGLVVPGMIQCDIDLAALEIGQHVTATLLRAPFKPRRSKTWDVASIDQVLEGSGDIASAVALSRFGMIDRWPTEVSVELDSIVSGSWSQGSKHRKDLRMLPFVTIDPATANDHDDAVYCVRLDTGDFRLQVAIADVAEYVKPGSALDATALQRGASIYFPDRALPMLPPQLSSDACSLKAGQDRLALVCDMVVTRTGQVADYEFYEATIRSHAGLSYEDLNGNIQSGQWSAEIKENLNHLFEVHDAFLQSRVARGVLNLDVPAASIEIDSAATIKSVSKTVRLASHGLVEEAMLAANTCAAKLLAEHFPEAAMYRIHEKPPADKLQDLNQLLDYFGVGNELSSESTVADYQTVVARLSSHHPGVSSALQIHLLRSLATAVYSPDNQPHFALNFLEYTHFTSPIRRYPDLVVHRLIKQVLHGRVNAPQATEMARVATLSSNRERRAESCAREAEGWLKAQFMHAYVGRKFKGVIVDVRNFGIFVQLDSPFIDGMVPVSELGGEYFHYQELSRSLAGSRTGRVFEIGQRVTVVLTGANPELGHIDFELV